MSAIWVSSPSPHIINALSSLLESIGYNPAQEAGPEVRVMICDLCSTGPPYPPAPSIPTLALVCTDDEEELADLLLLGYKGFLPGYTDAKALASALEALEKEELFASDHVSSLALIRAFGGKEPLTVEQARILVLAKEGLSTREIAEQLNLSYDHVRRQLGKAYKKLGVRRRGSLKKAWHG